MPEVRGPDEIERAPVDLPMIPPYWSRFDMRWAIGDMPFSGSSGASVGGWLRLVDPAPIEAPLVACLADAWAPAILPRATTPLVAPTVDLTVHFRTAFPASGVEPDDFLLGRFSSQLSRDGFFEEDGELWTRDGRLLAQSRQLALSLPLK
jgi:acyl-CoA thioesterase